MPALVLLHRARDHASCSSREDIPRIARRRWRIPPLASRRRSTRSRRTRSCAARRKATCSTSATRRVHGRAVGRDHDDAGSAEGSGVGQHRHRRRRQHRRVGLGVLPASTRCAPAARTNKQSESDPRPDLAYSRTHLANQRTYATWLRTGLSTAAAGLVLARLTPREALERPTAITLGALLVGLGACIILFGA